MEVGLLHLAGFQRHFAVQRGAQAEHHRALHLLADVVGVDGGAAVDGCHHPVHADALGIGRVHRHLGHLGHDAAEAVVQRDAARPRCAIGRRCQRLAPAGLVGRLAQHRCMARVVLQQRQAEGQRVLPGHMGRLVDEAFLEEGLVRMAHAAPEAHRHR
jgi:hypothetical protein